MNVIVACGKSSALTHCTATNRVINEWNALGRYKVYTAMWTLNGDLVRIIDDRFNNAVFWRTSLQAMEQECVLQQFSSLLVHTNPRKGERPSHTRWIISRQGATIRKGSPWKVAANGPESVPRNISSNNYERLSLEKVALATARGDSDGHNNDFDRQRRQANRLRVDHSGGNTGCRMPRPPIRSVAR